MPNKPRLFLLSLLALGLAHQSKAADLPVPGRMGPYSASVTAYSATDPARKNKNGRNARGSCGSGLEGANESATGPKPLDNTLDGGSNKVMLAVPGLKQFKNCQLDIPGVGNNLFVMDHMPGGTGISRIDVSHKNCDAMEKFGKRTIAGIYVTNVGKDGCNPDRPAKKKAKRRRAKSRA